jgi:hypothetical protein
VDLVGRLTAFVCGKKLLERCLLELRRWGPGLNLRQLQHHFVFHFDFELTVHNSSQFTVLSSFLLWIKRFIEFWRVESKLSFLLNIVLSVKVGECRRKLAVRFVKV